MHYSFIGITSTWHYSSEGNTDFEALIVQYNYSKSVLPLNHLDCNCWDVSIYHINQYIKIMCRHTAWTQVCIILININDFQPPWPTSPIESLKIIRLISKTAWVTHALECNRPSMSETGTPKHNYASVVIKSNTKERH